MRARVSNTYWPSRLRGPLTKSALVQRPSTYQILTGRHNAVGVINADVYRWLVTYPRENWREENPRLTEDDALYFGTSVGFALAGQDFAGMGEVEIAAVLDDVAAILARHVAAFHEEADAAIRGHRPAAG